MAKNENLKNAKAAKNDEFYTQLTDVEKELMNYKHHFKDKVVLCNCNDARGSAFWRYFDGQFDRLQIRRLIATHYEPNGKAYMLDKTRVGEDSPTVRTELDGDGDFRSEECIELLKQADIVCTNPPFSHFREIIALLMEHNKKFLLIGNKNAITYKEFFPLLKDNKVWIGYNMVKEFEKPDGTIQKFGNIGWFTNLDIKKRHENMDLFERYKGNEDHYPKYDNYNAIEVSKVVEIPKDYNGMMGVPITFLDKYNPDQFEVIGMAKRGAGDPALKSKVYTKEDYSNYSDLNAGPVLIENGVLRNTYPRILIKRKGNS